MEFVTVYLLVLKVLIGVYEKCYCVDGLPFCSGVGGWAFYGVLFWRFCSISRNLLLYRRCVCCYFFISHFLG